MRNKKKTLILGIAGAVLLLGVGVGILYAATSWSGTGTGECECEEVACTPFAEWSGIWTDQDVFCGTWVSGEAASGTFTGTVSYLGGVGCTYKAQGTWSIDDGPTPAGDFYMCFSGSNCYGGWDADYVEGCDCSGSMSGSMN